MMSAIGHIGVVLGLLVSTGTAIADDGRPLREARSENELFELRIEAGRPGRVGRNCQATLYEHAKGSRSGRRIWQRALVNDVAPAFAFIRNDGRFLLTLDEYERGGARHALAIYGAHGDLLRHFLLQDLLAKDDWPHVHAERKAVNWLKDAKCAFDDEAGHFVIALQWGRELRVDLKTLGLIRDGDQTLIRGLTAIPVDLLTALLGHLETGSERIIAERIAELADSTPAEQLQAQEIAAELTPEETPAVDTAPTEPPAEETDLAAATPDDQELDEPEAPPVVAEGGTEAIADAVEPTEVMPEDVVDKPATAALSTAGVWVPQPNAADPVDYVAWVNEMGRVDGPDARPLYESAIEQLVDWEGDSELLRAAASGDLDALTSPELTGWLAENEAALATFREASRYPAKSWEHHSETGAMIDVVLPSLSPMRELARASIVEGRLLAAEGNVRDAADRYLDTLAAGGHTGRGFTLIEDLVGMAMQAPAAEALLDLASGPGADDLDFASLAHELETAYEPARSAAESLQGERACFLDTAQRLWEVDRATGEHRVNVDRARQILGYLDDGDQIDAEAWAAEVTAAGFENTTVIGNAYYDAVTDAMSLPYPQASHHLAQIEELLNSGDDTNPLLRHIAPALSRYHFIHVRGEAVRRATLLTANVQAYRQQHGEYPDSLAAFAGRDFARDPFSDAGFVYRRVGDDFVLYSVGGNGIDDAAVHDRKGDTNDLVFWPRPD